MNLLPAFVGKPEVNRVYNCDALTLLKALPDASVNLIATDPPYNGVKADAWDNQWATDADYLAWLGAHLAEFRRVLTPNGSLYLFASPRMAARVEVLTGEYFNVLNGITWKKSGQSYAEVYGVENFRGFVEMSERIIFAEQYGSDEHASGEAGYEAQCQAICREVFQVADLCAKFGISRADIGRLIVSDYKNMESAQAQASNWILGKNIPNPSDFQKLKTVIPIQGEYTALRQQYEALRQQYEALRRPFNVSADVPYTDVWDFPTVGAYPGKHPCEKPAAMMRHIINASSRPGDVVLDCFCGSGITLAAAFQLGRKYIGCDRDPHWVQVSQNKCVTEFGGKRRQTVVELGDLPLFASPALESASA